MPSLSSQTLAHLSDNVANIVWYNIASSWNQSNFRPYKVNRTVSVVTEQFKRWDQATKNEIDQAAIDIIMQNDLNFTSKVITGLWQTSRKNYGTLMVMLYLCFSLVTYYSLKGDMDKCDDIILMVKRELLSSNPVKKFFKNLTTKIYKQMVKVYKATLSALNDLCTDILGAYIKCYISLITTQPHRQL